MLSTLAVERYFTGDRARCDALSAEAVTLARRLDDRGALAGALADRHVAISGPDTVEERLALAEEMLALTTGLGPDVEARARLHRMLDRLEAGDGEGFHEDLRAVAALAARHGLPLVQVQVGWVDNAQVLYKGDFVSAERLMQQAFARNAQVNPEDALMAMGGQLCQLQHLRGTVPGFADQVRRAIDDQPQVATEWSMVLALVLCDERQLDELGPLWRRLRSGHFDDLRRDMVWSLLLVAAAEISLTLGDVEAAVDVERHLEVLAGKVATFGTGHMCWGAVDRYRGMAALAQGRLDDAIERLHAGIELDERLGGSPFVALGRFRLAQAMAARGGPGDAARAAELLASAADTATALGMGRLQAMLTEHLTG